MLFRRNSFIETEKKMLGYINAAISKMMVTEIIENRQPVQEPMVVIQEDRKRKLDEDCERIGKRLQATSEAYHKSNSLTK